MLIHLHAVRKLRRDVVNGVKTMLSEGALHQRGVAKVALNAGKPRKGVFIGFKVDIDDGVAFTQKTPFKNTAKEARSAGYQDM